MQHRAATGSTSRETGGSLRPRVSRRIASGAIPWTDLCGGKWFDLVECARESVAFDFELVAALEVEPEPIAGAEVPGEPQCCVGGDPALAVHDLVDAARRYTDGDGDAVLGDAELRCSWCPTLDSAD